MIILLPKIDAAAATPVINTTVSTYKSPVSSTDLNNPAITTILKYQYYDDYSFAVAKNFDAAFDNNTAYSNSDPNVIPVASSKRTLSYPTGSMVRVLGTNTFLTSTEYYDEKGRHIQTIESNIKNGQDITTMQYHFDGRLLSLHSKHSTSYSGYNNFSILTKNNFDKIGRIISVEKKYGTNTFKIIASYDYDDVGRLLTKYLDPGYTGSGKNEMESLTYSYDIHNNITGINRDYALKTPGKYTKWGNFFGLYLGYDDNTNFTAQLDGHVAGIMWNTQGDDAQRKYDYTYDNAGRLINALFKQRQKTSDTWDNSKMDFSVTGSTGKITYDVNGNLLDMLQKAVLPGQSAPIDIDKLAYSYTANTNKLKSVTDNTTTTTTNGQSGDFSDGTGGTGATDYYYDDNGNLVKDLNKNVKDLGGTGNNGIKYNFLDKSEQIRITGKGVIRIVYDAEGNKLQKIYTPVSGTAVTTTYINQYVYKENDLQYINFEEGRIRVITPLSVTNGYDAVVIDGNMTLPNSKEGVYDYFIRDYQENVRMILTEEVHTGSNKCTMETDRAGAEEPVFGQTGSANEVGTTRFLKPQLWGTNTSTSVSRVGNLAATKAGPNSLLKVMAGDQITASADYYYKDVVMNTTGNNLTTPVLGALIAAITGSGATGSLVKNGTSGINTQLNADPLFVSKTAPHANNSNGNKPKAYLTILFFDERFNYVEENSTFIRVSVRGDGAAPLALTEIKAPKNGYVYAYLSNESDEMVYFDNFNVVLTRGRIIEEDHYYAYGLKIAALSSQKFSDPNEGNIDNKNLYNDKELFDDADLDWYDYGFRNYDAQIGRFVELDPLMDNYTFNSPYDYAVNDPVSFMDVDGLGPGETLQQSLAAALSATASAPGKLLENVVVTSTTKAANTAGVALNAAAKIAMGAPKIIKESIPGGPKPPLLPIRPYSKETVRAYTSGAMENWSNSKSLLGKLTYSIADDTWITLQCFNVFLERDRRQHIGGGGVNDNESVRAGVNTLALTMPGAGEVAELERGGLFVLEKGFQLSKDVVAKGVSVIGPKETYREFAKKIGASFLDVTNEAWSLKANIKFLQGVVKRGDDVIFAGKSNPSQLDVNSILAKEIRYLIKRGYEWTDDFSRLIKK